MADEQQLVQEMVSEFNALSTARMNFDSHWKEIAERVLPAQKNLFSSQNRNITKGEKRSEHIFDSTASTALSRFTSILESLLTPRSSTWHRLTASNPDLNSDRDVRLWFDIVNNLLFKARYAPDANFQANNQSCFESLGAFGTSPLFIDRLRGGKAKGLRYKHTHLGETYFAENHQGIIDKSHRFFPITARQMMQRFDPAKVPPRISGAKNQETEFYVLHCIKPRTDQDPTRLDFRGKAYASYYISYDDKAILEEGGYTSFPYAVGRWKQTSGEVYGRSPAMEVLPAIKTLNEQKKTILKAGHRVVDPVLLVHDDDILDAFSMRPGALNSGAVSANGNPLVHALPVGNLQIGKELMDDERSVINDAFLVTLFQILVETPQMTATEVLQRTQEKGFLLAPTVGRQQAEYCGSMITRELDVLREQRLLPPMPQILIDAAGEYEIEYESPLTRSQQTEEAVGLMRVLDHAMSVINITQDRSIIDFIDFDEAMPTIARIQGVPEKWMKTKDAVAQQRQQRSQQQQQQMATQQAPGAAALLNAGAKAAKVPQ